MPLNVPGILVPFQLFINPRIIVPALSVKDIRQLNFHALKKAGYKGAVFDKDNCLTVPYKDALVPELESSWKECCEVFGEGNVLIVSNSAGSFQDAGGIQAEAINHHLGVPVLFHASMKPSYPCIDTIRTYFGSLRHPIKDRELVIIGDRLFTDIVMANRMNSKGWTEYTRDLMRSVRQVLLSKGSEEKDASHAGSDTKVSAHPRTLAVWTTGVWKREAMVMRFGERKLLEVIQKWTKPREGEVIGDIGLFTRELPSPSQPTQRGLLQQLTARLHLKRS
ncbi:HAD-superfamily phosphatase [Dendrothele bispora CBS 962.96]|uniref:HAD-superfamily phosphatase n=1 Tax=Dendrothele bispora (strain CBS 962.96) TaxID=1314807 RepID=A0A4S8MSS5_DENBC|nr:HAD-superfamily phosphatase [Dendrothele bispora CBS 962.96]